MTTRIRISDVGLAVVAAAALLAAPTVTWAATRSCMAGTPMKSAMTQSAPKEASDLLNAVRDDAQVALNAADVIRVADKESAISWEFHVEKLGEIKDAVNALGAKLCTLQAIRSDVLPWQQQAIDRLGAPARLMADNADNAIRYLNDHQSDFWVPAYNQSVSNIYTEATQLDHTVKTFEQRAHLEQRLSSVERSIETPSGS